MEKDFSRREEYERLTAALAPDAEVEALMKPLLDGEMDYETHRTYLQSLLEGRPA